MVWKRVTSTTLPRLIKFHNKNILATRTFHVEDDQSHYEMGLLNFVNALGRKTIRLIIFTLRIQVVIISYIVTSVASVFYGKEAVCDSPETGKMEEIHEFSNNYEHLEKIDENSEEENERHGISLT